MAKRNKFKKIDKSKFSNDFNDSQGELDTVSIALVILIICFIVLLFSFYGLFNPLPDRVGTIDPKLTLILSSIGCVGALVSLMQDFFNKS